MLIDGEPRRSCLVPVAELDGALITTVEGLGPPGDLSPVQAAFHQKYAAQCGFCTGGMIMAAHALIERVGGEVSREQVTEALSGHVCRCTGYVKIVEAVIAASRGDVDLGEADEMPVPERDQPQVEPKGSPA